MLKSIARCAMSFVAVVAFSLPLAAQDPTALQVTGPDGQVMSFSIAALDMMEQVTFATTTIWTDGEVVFRGPSLNTVLEEAGIAAETVTLTALNDYAIEMPVPDGDFPIVATSMNGAAMSVRDKGPFWIVFPYDSDPSYQIETIFSQSIWQLDRIETLD